MTMEYPLHRLMATETPDLGELKVRCADVVALLQSRPRRTNSQPTRRLWQTLIGNDEDRMLDTDKFALPTISSVHGSL